MHQDFLNDKVMLTLENSVGAEAEDITEHTALSQFCKSVNRAGYMHKRDGKKKKASKVSHFICGRMNSDFYLLQFEAVQF